MVKISLVLFLTSFLTACGTNKVQKFFDNAVKRIELKNVGVAIDQGKIAEEKAAELPPQPKVCNQRVLSGVKRTDSWEQSSIKLGIALEKSNNRLQECYNRYEKVRRAWAKPAPKK